VTEYDALLLVSFGGPEGPDDVMSFLERVTHGRGVPRDRLEAVAHHYLELGGVSPINGQNRALLAALRPELDRRGIRLPLAWGNRNSAPFIPETLRELHASGARRILAVTTAAYASYSGCRQYREDLASAITETGLEDLEIDKVRLYYDHPGFIEPFVDGVARALAGFAVSGVQFDAVRILCTTHSIPLTMAEASGPPDEIRAGRGGAYVAQHKAVVGAILAGLRARGLATPLVRLVYQSRSGSPDVPWLEPDISEALHEIRADGAEAVIVVPIGFVSDHVEVVWDLDHEAAATAEGIGLRFERVQTPGTHPAFVEALAGLVEERVRDVPAALRPAGDAGPWPDRCPPGCCRNLRVPRPAVAGSDEPSQPMSATA
jgi:protoporphyrin/coproporphyrin ferrochelatase